MTQTINALEALTVVRIRGEISFFLDLVTASGDGFQEYGIGIGIASGDAIAVGATALPTPLGDKDWPGWLFHHSGASIVGAETTEAFRGPMSAVRMAIDTKSMRKIGLNETVFASFETGAEIGTAQLEVLMNTRMLLKLY